MRDRETMKAETTQPAAGQPIVPGKYQKPLAAFVLIALGVLFGTGTETIQGWICPPCGEKQEQQEDPPVPQDDQDPPPPVGVEHPDAPIEFSVYQAEPVEWSEPVALIEGPEQGEVGRMIVLDGSETIGDAVAWDAINLPHADDWKVCGREVHFVVDREGIYEFRLWAATCKDGIPVFNSATHTVTVGKGEPPDVPPDKPGPAEPPAQPEPPGSDLGLSKKAFDFALYANPIERARDVAFVYRITSQDTTLTTSQQMATRNIEDLRKKLGDDVAGWREWYGKISEELIKLERDKQLTSIDDFRAAYREIAIGLETLP